MASLHFHYGTMGSSKSAQLIITAYNFRQNGTETEIIKPQYDTRFSPGEITSRIGISTPALALPDLSRFVPKPDTKFLLVDEVQFFSPYDIDKLVWIADNTGIIVMCYGLMVDSNEKLFPASQRLIEVGAKLHHMESSCQIPGCTKLATHHLRFSPDGHVIRAGEQFALGDSNYKSVCRGHFNMLYKSDNRHTR